MIERSGTFIARSFFCKKETVSSQQNYSKNNCLFINLHIMKNSFFIGFIIAFLFPFSIYGQHKDSIELQLTQFVRTASAFSEYIPQEKVYLHFDNNSYYRGDNIWFKCYIVSSKLHTNTPLSKTLYVDLLNPGGEIVAKKTLEIKEGQCHGDFILNSPTFYSGFYEVRAYTKYMLNFGDDAIFSRVFPVFDTPQQEGHFTQRTMLKNIGKHPMKRKKTDKKKKLNVTFLPEGGNLVYGIESRIAFHATDESGAPLLIKGSILDKKGKETSIVFSSNDKGMGSFAYTPTNIETRALIYHEDKKYTIDLPQAMTEGYTVNVDNLSNAENISINISKNEATSPDILGMITLCRGDIYSFNIIDFRYDNNLSLSILKGDLPAGINQIILFNKDGEPLCERLIFINQKNYVNITSNQDKESYNPYELVNMNFHVTDNENTPINTSFSLSVKDATYDDIYYSDNIQTNLLLSSDIKGYIHNPSYYFEKDDIERQQALDLLLMTQGWRRYSWKQMIGKEPFSLKHMPEQGVEIKGIVRSPVRKKLKPNIDITLALTQTDENDQKRSEYIIGKADSLGQFRIISNLYGKWDMALGVSEKGKKKNENIILDRLFKPEARSYTLSDLEIKTVEQDNDKLRDNKDKTITDTDIISSYIDDSLSLGIDQKIHHLKDVIITAKEEDSEYKRKPVAFYDVQSEMNDIIDNGDFVGNDFYEFLLKVSPHFFREIIGGEYIYTYKGKPFIVVKDRDYYHFNTINGSMSSNYIGTKTDPYFALSDNKVDYSYIDIAKITQLNAIKSVYINEDLNLLARFFPLESIHEVQRKYSGIVFFETQPETKIPNGARGIRKLKLEGYDLQKEFYNPNYSILPKEPDYRRTLYWNPNVTTDNEGRANVQFYNNSSCKKMNISAETVTAKGMTGIYKKE